MRRWLAFALIAGCLGACSGAGGLRPAESLFIGIDVSGSFQKSPYSDNAMEFLSYYLYGRMTGKGDLQPLKTLFVGSIGGQMTEESKSFHPIQDFEGKTPDKIYADLKTWFPQSDKWTDFNIFFQQVALIAEKRNLALSPITIVLLTDGIPDEPGQGEVTALQANYRRINVSSLEYSSRKVTVRVLYLSPVVAKKWETLIERKRVRLWTVDDQVMAGWKAQQAAGAGLDSQDKLWKWILDNVDYRVRPLKNRVRPPDEKDEPAPAPQAKR